MSIKTKLQIAVLGAVLLGSSSVGAQPAPAAMPTLKSLGVECDDFAPIGNGMWKPTHPFDMMVGATTVSMTPIKTFGPGDMFAGVPLAKVLAGECK